MAGKLSVKNPKQQVQRGRELLVFVLKFLALCLLLYNLLLLSGMAYVIVRVVQSIRRGRQGARVALSGFLVAAIASAA